MSLLDTKNTLLNSKYYVFTTIFSNKNNSIDKLNIYKLLKNDKRVQSYIAQNNNNNFETYILNYKNVSRNNANTFLHDVTDLFAWYKIKNPEFKPLGELKDLQMPEFATLLLTIAMNVMKMLIELKYPGSKYKNTEGRSLNNKKSYFSNNTSANLLNKPIRLTKKEPNTNNNNNKRIEKDNDEFLKLKSILDDINNEDNLNVTDPGKSNYFSYKVITEIYLKFIAYTSGNFKIEDFNLDNINSNYAKETCDYYIDYIKRIYKYTPFIIYPTFNQLNELIVLKTMSSPVINFLITYTRVESHYQYLAPCYHIDHDILFHGIKTHLLLYTFIENSIIIRDHNGYRYNFSIAEYLIEYTNKIKKLYSDIISKIFNNLISSKMTELEIKSLFNVFHEDGSIISLLNIYTNFIKSQKNTNTGSYENFIIYIKKIFTTKRKKIS